MPFLFKISCTDGLTAAHEAGTAETGALPELSGALPSWRLARHYQFVNRLLQHIAVLVARFAAHYHHTALGP